MLNLVVEVAHPPVAEPSGVDVDGVDSTVFEPVSIFVLFSDGKVSVRESEVEEDVSAAHASRENISTNDLTNRSTKDLRTVPIDEDGTHGEEDGFAPLSGQLAVDEAGVEDELPREGDEEAGDGSEEEGLSREPEFLETTALLDTFSDALVE